jgi:ferredoxin
MSRVNGGSGGSRVPRHDVVALAVDWPACRARGLCAELLPEHVFLDEWGYPVVHGPVPGALRDHAVDAVRACPHRALRLVAPPA